MNPIYCSPQFNLHEYQQQVDTIEYREKLLVRLFIDCRRNMTRTEKDGQRAKQQAEIDEDNRKAEEARLAAEKQAKAKAAAKKSQDNLQKAERTNKLKDVDAAVSKAERTKDKSQVAYAHVKVSELSDVLQQDYLTRLNKIK